MSSGNVVRRATALTQSAMTGISSDEPLICRDDDEA
jgi:hypothetical protein